MNAHLLAYGLVRPGP